MSEPPELARTTGAVDMVLTSLAMIWLAAAMGLGGAPREALTVLVLLPMLAWGSGVVHGAAARTETAVLRAVWPLLVAPAVYLAQVRIVSARPDRYVDGWLATLDRAMGLYGTSGAIWPMGGLVEEVSSALYASYYLIPALVLRIALGGRPDVASRYTLALVLATFACGIGWLLLPAGGYHPGGGPTSEPFGPATALMRAIYASAPHHAAALPSEHVAHAAACAYVARAHGWGRWVWVWVLGVALSTVVGQYHYAVDGVAGWAVGVAAGAVAMAVARGQLTLGSARPMGRGTPGRRAST